MNWEEQVFVATHAPYRPPRSLLWALYRLDDGHLRLRWSTRQERWCLETKRAPAVTYLPRLRHWVKRADGVVVENDSWVRARDGYLLLQYVAPWPPLGDWFIRNLQYGDPWRFHGPADIARLLEQQEAAQLAAVRRRHQTQNEAHALEWLESEIWRQGERVAVPPSYHEVHNG